jgi:hypothetical protein
MSGGPRRRIRGGPIAPGCVPKSPRSRPPRSARAADVVAFLAAERGRGLSVTTVELRRAAIRTPHFICGCAQPTAEAQVSETMAGIDRVAADAGQRPVHKLAATADILRQILAPIPPDLAGMRDRAPAGRLRRRAAPRRARHQGYEASGFEPVPFLYRHGFGLRALRCDTIACVVANDE